jgi:phosphate transport system substrate-binding protein
VQRTRFSIGYVEYAYAREHRLSDVSLRNHSGQFVQAGRKNFTAAAEAVDWHALATMQQLPTDAPGNESWPITGASFILVGTSPGDRAQTRAALRFFEWCMRHGARTMERLDFASLPEEALDGLPALWAPLLDGTEKPPGP